VRRATEAADALAAIGGGPAIAETPADFRRELAIIAARGRDGEIALYPLTESHHENGILRRTTSPARGAAKAFAEAERIAAILLTALDYVGVLGVELFERDDGRLLVNEFAPRVHNTGHWTLDGCAVDQFEQHIRAIAGWPLGPTRAEQAVEMINLLGDEVNGWARFAAEPESRLWLYGKAEAKPGRKMGHVNRITRPV
jgi:5-(carboxyamino)imidazole ribonucleotide synthase